MKYDVGVIIGRFQTVFLHVGHRALFEEVVNSHKRVICLLGVSQAKCSRSNPLDFETREKMIESFCPGVIILPLLDNRSDHIWSKNLDELILNLVGPDKSVRLYGGRDCCKPYYHGKFPFEELALPKYEDSATSIRKEYGSYIGHDSSFRHGVIWATQNQWPKCWPVVDAIIFNQDKTKVLLGRKKDETLFRLIGGFVNPGETYEQAVVQEE